MRRLYGILVPTLLGAAVLAGCTDFKISPPKDAPGGTGRYAIASPQKEIFLLDTATGKTWVLVYEQEVPRWRPVHMEGEEAVPSESKAPESKTPESKPPESKATESKPTESKAPESKPTGSKPTEGKPTESKPTESKPTESKPAESKPPEGKAPESKPPGSKAAESKPPAGKTPEKPPAPKDNTAVDNAAKSPPRKL